MHPSKYEMFKVLSEHYRVSVYVIASWFESCNKAEALNEKYEDHHL
jgi:hypothetical protein